MKIPAIVLMLAALLAPGAFAGPADDIADALVSAGT